MPFEDDVNSEINHGLKKTGIKDSGKKSIFDNMVKKPKREDFERAVDKVEDEKTQQINRLSAVIQKITTAVNDKTLETNKNPFNKSIENESLKDLIDVLNEINNDDREPEGYGSMTGISLLMKLIFRQRDRINELEFSMRKLRNDFDKHTQSVELKK